MDYDIFLSYKSCDREWVARLRSALVAVGMTVWMDREEIRPGDSFVEAIERGLESSRAIAIVVSPESMSAGWVKEEYQHAISLAIKDEKTRRIIPLLLRDAELPGFLQNRQWVDFRDESEFESSLQHLIWGIKGDWPAADILLPEGESLALHDIMLKARRSLIISGHTLDKFTQGFNVRNAFGALLALGVQITTILLNPLSAYAKAHEPFHLVESRTLASSQTIATILGFQNLFDLYNRPRNLTVLLSNYMPRFRTIIIDDELCFVNLYMYSADVGTTPEFKLSSTGDGNSAAWFRVISASTKKLINSQDVIPLIQDGRFNARWEHGQIGNLLDRSLESLENFDKDWSTICCAIQGYQNEDSNLAYREGICNRSYQAGTFMLDEIRLTASFLESPTTFEEWLQAVLEEELDHIEDMRPGLFRHEAKETVLEKARKVMNDPPYPYKNDALKHTVWYQEYPEVVHRLLMTILTGDPNYDLNLYPDVTRSRKDFIFKVLSWLERSRKPSLQDWLRISVAAGLLGIDKKPFHLATSAVHPFRSIRLDQPGEDEDLAVRRVADELWQAAISPCRVDATNVLFHILDSNLHHNFRIVSFPGDYLETIVLLWFYAALLKKYPRLEIFCVPQSVRCRNDASLPDVEEFLKQLPLPDRSERLRLVENGPLIGGVNLLKLHPEVLRLMKSAAVLDVRGARNYEMMQGVNAETFFGFMVCRESSEAITGFLSQDCPFIYVHQNPGERSFEGYRERHTRQENGRMFARLTVRDLKSKWEGGHLASFDSWTADRKDRFRILRDFYNRNAPKFSHKFGGLLEPYVQRSFDVFSGKVLVIGCGAGKEVNYLAQRGCDVWGFDFSYLPIALAQTSYPDLKNRFFVEDYYNLDTIMSGEFDGIIANAVFVHLLERDDMFSLLEKIRRRLKNDGLCYIRVIDKEGFTEEMDHNLFEGTRWFVYYTEEDLRKFAEQAGFIVDTIQKHPHMSYPDVYWVCALLRKPDQSTA